MALSETAIVADAQTNRPLVSVVLLNWNSGALGALATRSVLNQSWSPIELIIVDNASTDDSLDQMVALAPDALVRSHDENLGFAKGMNAGIAAARGDYVLPLNCDAELDEPYVERLLAVLDQYPRAAAAGGMVRSKRAGATGPLAVTWLMRTSNMALSEPSSCDKVNGACPLFRMSALTDVIARFGGPYDESYGTYGEDIDLAETMRRLGWIYRYEPEATARHVRSYASAMRVADKRGSLRVSTIANRHRNIARHAQRLPRVAACAAILQDVAFCTKQTISGDREAVPDVIAAWRYTARYRAMDRERRLKLP